MENYIITKLENYRKYFGDILFPDELVARREVGKNPANWMYSFDGRAWEPVPMDIGKIDYFNALFRPKPEGCILGITEDIKKNPELYQYSHDNGNTWEDLWCDNYPSHNWIYHGTHSTTWFRRAYHKPKDIKTQEE